jgi:hypothetical protein
VQRLPIQLGVDKRLEEHADTERDETGREFRRGSTEPDTPAVDALLDHRLDRGSPVAAHPREATSKAG